MIGVHHVYAYPEADAPTGTPEDVTCLVDELAITYGRSETGEQPDPASVTIDVTVGPGTPLPEILDVGSWVRVTTTIAGTTYDRFLGRVTDIAIGWDDAGTQTPDAGVGQVVAVSVLADYARAIVGAEPFPQELDGERVARVLELAGLVLDPATSDPGTVEVIPRDIDARSALEVAQDTATSAGGLVWETPSGDIRYADADHRRGATVELELDSCDVLVSPSWTRTVSGLVNEIALGYGVEPEEGGDAPTYFADNPESRERFGRYAYSVTTELARLQDAQSVAWLILGQNREPVWMLRALPIDVASLSAAATQKLLELQLHSLIRVTGLPATGQTPTSIVPWVEGWTERLAWGIHELELTVSDYCRTSSPPRWDDQDPGLTWDAAVGTWDSILCTGAPPADQGRWDDVAATTRWDQVDPEVAWDETAQGVPS